jgi:phosphohistidine phosphatase
MKTLYIVRHGKTNKSLDDLSRELLPIGIERMKKLGNYLSVNNCKIDVLYSSYAKRAQQTAELIADAILFPKDKTSITEELSFTSQDAYFDILVEQDNEVESVLFVGHNPEITNVAQFFIPDFTAYMQTGSCFCFDFDTDEWTKIFTAERKNRFYVRFE